MLTLEPYKETRLPIIYSNIREMDEIYSNYVLF